MSDNNLSNFIEYAQRFFNESKDLASTNSELLSMYRKDRCWLEGYANGLHKGGLLTDEELNSVPSILISIMKAEEV